MIDTRRMELVSWTRQHKEELSQTPSSFGHDLTCGGFNGVIRRENRAKVYT